MPNTTYDKMKELLKDIEQAIREEEKSKHYDHHVIFAYNKIRKAFRDAYPKGL